MTYATDTWIVSFIPLLLCRNEAEAQSRESLSGSLSWSVTRTGILAQMLDIREWQINPSDRSLTFPPKVLSHESIRAACPSTRGAPGAHHYQRAFLPKLVVEALFQHRIYKWHRFIISTWISRDLCSQGSDFWLALESAVLCVRNWNL